MLVVLTLMEILPMHRNAVSLMIFAASLMLSNTPSTAQTPANSKPSAAEPAWVERSNQYTQLLLDVQMKHSPESASIQGQAQYDSAITDATRADEIAQRKELEAVLANLKKVEAKEKDPNVRQDLQILQKTFDLRFRQDDYQLTHKVEFVDAGQAVFIGLRTLLDDQVEASRRPAAMLRLRKYAGLEPGYKPFTEMLKQRMMEQMAKPGVTYPTATQMEAAMARDKNYIGGMQKIFVQYKQTGWEDPFAKLQQQLADYDTWVRKDVMPKANSNFRLTPEEYELHLANYGVDLPSAQLVSQARAEFTQIQTEMAPLAVEVARQHGWKSTDYRDVLRELKKTQISGEAILPFYQQRLKAIEVTIAAKNLVSLPNRPTTLRMATTAETAQSSDARMIPPPFLHNTGQRGEFVLPLNAPVKDDADQHDDYTYDAASWPLIAREARPGHDLQYDSILAHGVSNARALYAVNSTNIDGWGLYSEWLMQPYEPADGQLATLQQRLLLNALAFLDPDLQSGKTSPSEATKVLEIEVGLAPTHAKQLVERDAFRSPGQAISEYYSYITLLKLRTDTEAALGPKFNGKKFNDFLLAQGLLPPDLLRKAVMENFVPAQK
jgi:uncharacterized protein (DUF885 family)